MPMKNKSKTWGFSNIKDCWKEIRLEGCTNPKAAMIVQVMNRIETRIKNDLSRLRITSFIYLYQIHAMIGI